VFVRVAARDQRAAGARPAAVGGRGSAAVTTTTLTETTSVHPQTPSIRAALQDPPWVRVTLIALALGFVALFLLLPLLAVFTEALRGGLGVYWNAITDPIALKAIKLTLLVAAISVPANAVFGVAAAWAIARFEFRGKNLLITLIDLPFAVSPVISGLIFVLIFGLQGWLGPCLSEHDINIIFPVSRMVMARVFNTFPCFARVL